MIYSISCLSGIKQIVEACRQKSCPVESIVYQKEITYEEVRVEAMIKDYCGKQGIKVIEVWGSSLYHEQDVPFKKVPDTYTQFRKEVEGRAKVRALQPMPESIKPFPSGLNIGEIPDLAKLDEDLVNDNKDTGSKSAFPFSGGESAALER